MNEPACERPCCLPRLRVFWCFFCGAKTVVASERRKLEGKKFIPEYEEVTGAPWCLRCTREGPSDFESGLFHRRKGRPRKVDHD